MTSRLVLILCTGLLAASATASETVSATIQAGGLTRRYHLHVPPRPDPAAPVPLVLVFHGSGDTGAGIARFTRFDPLADRDGFLVAYPDAMSANWNDGREAAAIFSQFNNVDDVGLVRALIGEIGRSHRVDARRIYAAGFSNGGILVHYLAAHLAGQLAAIADVSGGIAEPFAPRFRPAAPLSVLMIHGTEDPMVPFRGGDVDFGGLGRVIDISAAVRLWTRHLAADAAPETGTLPDKDPQDQCRVSWSRWTGSTPGTELLLYTVRGGGHGWPGGPQFLPVEVIGRVCRDFDASEAIWDFFRRHPKPAPDGAVKAPAPSAPGARGGGKPPR